MPTSTCCNKPLKWLVKATTLALRTTSTLYLVSGQERSDCKCVCIGNVGVEVVTPRQKALKMEGLLQQMLVDLADQ